MKFTRVSFIIILFIASFTFDVNCQNKQQNTLITKEKRIKLKFGFKLDKIAKLNKSLNLVAAFFTKVTHKSFQFFAKKIKKICKVLEKSKIFQQMNTRIKQVNNNYTLLNKKIAKHSEEERKKAYNLMKIAILRLFREFYQNLFVCREIYSKKIYKTFKIMLQTINSVIWNRCKKFCSPFDYNNILSKFKKLKYIESKVFRKMKNRELEKLNENNARVLFDLINDYIELFRESELNFKVSTKNQENSKKGIRKLKYDYRLLI